MRHVSFDEPIDPDTVTEDAFHLIANGERLPGTIHVSKTERIVTFFHEQPFPASTETRVVVVGDLIVGRDGLAIDADGDGTPGGTTTADFSTVPLGQIPGTKVTGRVVASELDDLGNDVPLEGVTIRVDGLPEVFAVTDADGFFTLGDVPAPEFFVHVDRSTVKSVGGDPVPGDGFYPTVGKSFHSVPGQTVPLEMDGEPFNIHLPFILVESMHEVTPGQEITVALPDVQTASDPDLELVSLTVPADTLFADDGTPGTKIGVFKVESDRLPAPLPDGLEHSFDITVQADVSNFDEPAPITFPNTEGLAPGEKTLLMSFDHSRGEWVVVGTMAVSADGLTVTSDPGTGVLAPGWHGQQQGTTGGGGGVGEPPPPDHEFLRAQMNELIATEAAKIGIDVVSFGLGSPLVTVVKIAITCGLGSDQQCAEILAKSTAGHFIPGIGELLTWLEAAAIEKELKDWEKAQSAQTGDAHLAPSEIPQNIFSEQEQLLADLSDLYGAAFGDRVWIEIERSDWEAATGFMALLSESLDPSSPGGARIVQEERDVLIATPISSSISVFDVAALVDRFDQMAEDQLPFPDSEDIRASADSLRATIEELQSRGWRTLLDAFDLGLADISTTLGEELEDGPILPGEHYYRLTNLTSEFLRRGRTQPDGALPAMVMAPTSLYMIEYANGCNFGYGCSGILVGA